MSNIFAAIEAGGTKFIAALGTSDGKIIAQTRIPTTTPAETLAQCVRFFSAQQDELGAVSAIGAATFGPINLNPASPHYGSFTTTPKPGWSGFNLLTPLRTAFEIPIQIDTDVNGAALGEWRWGAAQGLDTFLYFTIGTGIGGGGLFHGQRMRGLLHPEMGHIPLPTNEEDISTCPYHNGCFEGLASGTAIEKRWQTKAEHLPVEHPAWEIVTQHIARAMHSFICTLSPQRIILGGGVMQQEHLFPLIRKKTLTALNGYVQTPEILNQIDQYIVPAALQDKAGILGALLLAEQALHQKNLYRS